MSKSSPSGPTSAAEIEQFLAPLVREHLLKQHTAGLTVAIVRDGRILYQRGYGYADLAQKKSVDPETTSFGVASLSKAFTAAAIMQLVEQGKLQLDRDLRTYLPDFPRDSAFPQPLTLEHLLTHTSGFDECHLPARRSEKPDAMLPWPEYRRYVLPKRLYPPGELVRYSNHNYTVAGYAIEAVAGMRFADYMQTNILGPLGMTHSSFARMNSIRASMPVAYTTEQSGLEPLPRGMSSVEPAASLASSASDMAHFLIALTTDGQYQGHHLLAPASVQAMERRHFEPNGVPSSGLGLWRRDLNGVEGWENIGGEPGFSSVLLLVPAHRTGFFVAANSGGETPVEIEAKLIEHYFPSASAESQRSLTETELQCSSGFYRPMSYASSTLDKAQLLLGGVEVQIRRDGRAGLELAVGDFHGQLVPESTPGTFRTPVGELITFRCIDEKPARYIAAAYSYYERLQFYDRRWFQALILGCSIVILALATTYLIISRSSLQERPLRLLAIGVSVAYLVFLGIALVLLGGFVQLEFMRGQGTPPSWLRLALCLPVLAASLSAGLTLTLVLRRFRVGPLSALASYLAIVLAAMGLSWLVQYWNLLPWRY